MARPTVRLATLSLAAVLLTVAPAGAVIMRLTPLKEVLAAEEFIFTATVERVDPDKPGMVVRRGENLKGSAPFERLAVNLTGDSEAKKDHQTPELLKRLGPDLSVIVFAHTRGPRVEAFVYTNGTWFQMVGQKDGTETRWAFTHAEPYLRRTFKGTTEELKQVVVDGLAGKKDPPEPDSKEPPGYGPEVKSRATPPPGSVRRDPTSAAGAGAFGSPLNVNGAGTTGLPFGVIPTFVIIGPLALLAGLFPAVFGGLALLMKRWMACLSVSCLASTVYFVHGWLKGWWRGTWFEPVGAMWLTLAALSALGVVWAGWRYRRAVRDGQAEPFQARRGDRIVVGVCALLGLGGVAFCLIKGWPLFDSPGQELLALAVPCWVGAVFLLAARPAVAGVSAETVLLAGLLLICTSLGFLEVGRAGAAAGGRAAGAAEGVAWTFEPTDRGAIYSSPVVAGDRVYAAAALSKGFSQYGKLYCLELATGKPVWEFDDDGQMMPVFCSPCLSGDRLYTGQGFHTDGGCKFFCLDAATGKKVWEFATGSHLESTPVVADGQVFFGAGDDGVYALDAATGQKVWQFPGVHVDSALAVKDGRVFGGSGVSRQIGEAQVFCLEAAMGRPVWRRTLPSSAWGAATLVGGRVYFGCGNGKVTESDRNPAGSVLCVDAADGQTVWECKVGDAVLTRPTADGKHVYFGSRDGHCYAADRATGQVVWKTPLGSPVVAAPAAAPDCDRDGLTRVVYAAGSGGRVCGLDPRSGRVVWELDLPKREHAKDVQVYAAPVLHAARGGGVERRRLFVGAGVSGLVASAAKLYCLDDEAP
jgi:outer membrane protein assembly factor BamB